MATYHLSAKAGGRNCAAPHALYITRAGRRSSVHDDLVATGYGNLPAWAKDNPVQYWKCSDKFERANGSSYKEYEIALPNELTREQNLGLINSFIERHVRDKTFLYAFHEPIAALGQVPQPHAHIMFSERQQDGLPRPPEQYFRRFNPHNPAAGGCRKGGCGRTKAQVREELERLRADWASMQNVELMKLGHGTSVDHRSLQERGLDLPVPQHLGPARVRAKLAAPSPIAAKVSRDVVEHSGKQQVPDGQKPPRRAACYLANDANFSLLAKWHAQ